MVVASDPSESVCVDVTTWLGESQYRVTVVFGGKTLPVTPILVLAPPAATFRTMEAWVGVGLGQGPLAGQPAWNPARTIGEMATSTAAATMPATITSAEVARNLGTIFMGPRELTAAASELVGFCIEPLK